MQWAPGAKPPQQQRENEKDEKSEKADDKKPEKEKDTCEGDFTTCNRVQQHTADIASWTHYRHSFVDPQLIPLHGHMST